MNRHPLNKHYLREALQEAWHEGEAMMEGTRKDWVNKMTDRLANWTLVRCWDRKREPLDGEIKCRHCKGEGRLRIAGNYCSCPSCQAFGIEEDRGEELPPAPTVMIPIDSKAHDHAICALREVGRNRCMSDNCGSICLCPPCHARAALKTLDPDWNPR